MTSRKMIYMDHAATTPTDPRVVEAMMPFFAERFENASTLYTTGRANEEAIEDARASIASFLSAAPEEIYFTSGGTESDNWAIKGVAYANGKKGRHVVTSAVEHHAALEACDFLEGAGWDVTVLPVSKTGLVDPAAVKDAIRPDTVLVTIMHANNEVGAIEPLEEIVRIAHSKGVLVHSDAVQTIGKIPVDVRRLGVDMLSASGHKFYGPKGTGFLYAKRGTRIEPLMHGGGHERGKRSGTSNVPGIIGMAKALELSTETLEAGGRLMDLAKTLWTGLNDAIPDMLCNTDFDNSLPGFLNIVVHGIEGEAMLLDLDFNGVCVSSGSACSTSSLEPSHVLLAIGLPPEVAHGSLRFTLGRENTTDDVRHVIEVLPKIVERRRAMSPTYKASAG